jgi:hypothetical protein
MFTLMLILVRFAFNCFSILDIVFLLCLSEIVLFTYLYLATWYHVIILIMLLELFILKNFFLSVFLVSLGAYSRYFIFLFATLRVAEARIGVSLLTIIVRSHGNDIIIV